MSSEIVITRKLEISLPKGKSAFLWGPRKSGKSTWLKTRFPQSPRFDFLRTDVYLDFVKRPALLRERLAALETPPAGPVILDEVQKIPALLDEVHAMMEDLRLSFILCGSSARKLKAGKANLLGGRAWRYHLHPLCWAELEESGRGLELLRALNHGLVPSHYFEREYRPSLRAYVYDYLKEEIMAEGLARNVPAFSRFLDAVAFSHGEIINHSNIARDCGVDSKTVREYFQILSDTLVGHAIEPYARSRKRDVILKAPKFYLFDVGVAGALMRRNLEVERGPEFGRAFEHLVLMELIAHRSYHGLDYPVRYWRTRNGLEVDFILGEGEAAIEVKGSPRVNRDELRSLEAFHEEFRPRASILVCNEKEPRKAGVVEVLPWREFFRRLWTGKIIG